MMLYELHFFGGPLDGTMTLSPRPYDSFREQNGHIYAAAGEGDVCLVWLADDRRRIDLHYCGVCKRRANWLEFADANRPAKD